jgi:hypothetical protein
MSLNLYHRFARVPATTVQSPVRCNGLITTLAADGNHGHLSRDEFLEVLGMTGGAFDQLQHAGHVALAFGTPMPATLGRYLDLDLVAMAINLGLAPSFGRENSTATVLGFFGASSEGRKISICDAGGGLNLHRPPRVSN